MAKQGSVQLQGSTQPSLGWEQVCLAAEECGHLHFDVRSDMWWNSGGFECEDYPPGPVKFRATFLKVCDPALHACAAGCWPTE